jgi:4'-phosphopantetheinyl transferase
VSPRVGLRLASVAQCVAQANGAGLPCWSPQEHARLSAMLAPARRQQFVAGHWLLRQLVQAFTQGGAVWQGETNPAGAPVLPSCPGVHLSIAHSADWVACAVSDAPVGVDVEAPVRARDVRGLAALAFSAPETQAAARLGAADASAHFYRTWTLKEAWLKSRGEMLDIARLPSIHTQAALPAQANARVWQSPGLTLALVAAAGADSVCAGLPDAAPTCWQVGA